MTSESVFLEPEKFLSLAALVDTIAIDTETNGQDIRDGRGFCIGISAAIRYEDVYYKTYLPVAHTKKNVSDEIKQAFFNIIQVVDRVTFHNAKFDLVSLETAGFTGKFKRWYCTMRMAHMLNENLKPNQYGLDWLAKNELHLPGKAKPPLWEVMYTIHGWSPDFPAEVMALYAAEDAVLALILFYHMFPKFVKSGFDGQVPRM